MAPPFSLEDLLARIRAGEKVDLEALELAHPTERAAIAEARALVRALVAQGRPPHESLAARLRARYGAALDPEVTLGGEGGETDPPAGASSEFLKRLAEHGHKHTHYRLEGELARGGMGAILRVWDEDLRRTLAMKVILGRSEAAASGGEPGVPAEQLARFLEEAQVTGQLDHPGIVPVHELGLDDEGRVYFTMKLVQGRNLQAVFDLVFAGQEGWNETRALSVILRACEALAYAHKKGVIHRDLKPANVMVGNFGEVYVMDWGLARVLGRKDAHDIRLAPDQPSALASVETDRSTERERHSDSPLVTLDGDVFGTPAYMSPEQARGAIEKLGPRSDVYSMGAMLYHLLARRAPYVPRGARIGNRRLLELVLQGPPEPLTSLRRDVPAELAAIVEKAMAREAAARYPDTLALAEDLRAFLEHRVVSAYESGAWAEAKKWVERNRPLAGALLAAVALLLAGLATSLVFKSRADENATLASKRAADLEAANATIRQRNQELARATAEAQGNERRAVEQERVATHKTNDVLSLSAIQELRDLEAEADELWPTEPQMLPAYESWLAKARLLIEGRAMDEGPGRPRRASLADHEALRAELREKARPLSPAEIEADRRKCPRYAEWETARAELTWVRRMLGREPWPSEADVEAELENEVLPVDVVGLNELAWPLVDVDPAKAVYGGEVRGLVLARRALAAAREGERGAARDTLAWALFRCGRWEEALAQEEQAAVESTGRQKRRVSAALEDMRARIARWRAPETPVAALVSAPSESAESEREARLAARVAELERDVNERRTYELDDTQDRWWLAQLSTLVSDLHAFTDERAGGLFSRGTSAEYGFGIVRRAEEARAIPQLSVSSPEAMRRWDEAIRAIAHAPEYGGLVLAPQLGLLPIGSDPDSHLWEFAHLQTGEPAVRGADGKLVLDEGMGLVFVLIPAGTFWMGAQTNDEQGRNHDPEKGRDEAPVHAVTLSAYFLSKYEMTQGQWLRFAGHNPSYCGPASYSASWNRAHRPWSALHPVEQVSWNDCMQVLGRLGLELPTEAQWENACRGGTSSVYWCGDAKEGLVDAGNVADVYARQNGGSGWSATYEPWDDGNTAHAVVGSFRGNAFGLHDVHGNVWEWCLDGYDGSFYGRSPPRDPVAPWERSALRVNRGGSFNFVAPMARSANRSGDTPGRHSNSLGVRPARAVRPASVISR